MNANSKPLPCADGELIPAAHMQWDYFDPWRAVQFVCDACGWRGLGSALKSGDLIGPDYSGYELLCPKCRDIVICMPFPSFDEVRANLDKLSDEERADFERSQASLADFEHRKLKRNSRLPDIIAPEFLLKWDSKDDETLIKYGERVIFREPGGWENYKRFIEVAELLRDHYGAALRDLVPTGGSFWSLNGDSCGVEHEIGVARERIFGIPKKYQIPTWGEVRVIVPEEWSRKQKAESRWQRLLPRAAARPG